MRVLTTEEMELILGGGGDTQTLPPVYVGPNEPPPAPPPAPAPGEPGPGDGGGNDGGGGGGGDAPAPAPPSCTPESTVPVTRINFVMTRTHEGGMRPDAYWPRVGSSGITIGAGVDLSRRLESELVAFGLPADDIARLRPYLAPRPGTYGIVGVPAQNLLAANGGLTLSMTVTEQLTVAMENKISNEVRTKFNAASQIGLEFDRVSGALQTVLYDAAFQMGSNGLVNGAGKSFFDAVAAGNFAAAAAALDNLGTSFDRRYVDNAALLRGAINSGELPANSNGVCQ